jgi:uncharacterized protein YqgC (DUF456 family)
MSVALAVLFLALATVSWASSVFALPGNWIVLLLALLFGWAEGFGAVRPWVLLVGFVLAALGEGVEFLSGYLGVKTFGGSRWAGVGALAGAVAGAILGAGFGYGLSAIPGTVLGAFAGAASVEIVRERRAGLAARAALGAALGRALGLAAKLSFGGAFVALLYLRVAMRFFSD